MASIKEKIKATGALSVVLTGPDGKVKNSFDIKNLVVQDGKEYIAQRMKDTGSPVQMSHMAIGSGATGPGEAALGDTALASQLARVGLTVAGGTVLGTLNEVEYTATFAPTVGTGAVTEAGIFNDGTAGAMLCRTTFDVVNKGDDDTLSITWTITIN